MITSSLMLKKLEKIGEIFGVDLFADNAYLKLKNPPYQPLVIETHHPFIHVMHYIRGRDGELMADPDMSFLIIEGNGARYLVPADLQQIFGYTRAVWMRDGNPVCNQAKVGQLKSFASMWARNIAGQGWYNATRVNSNADPAEPEIKDGELYEPTSTSGK